MNNNKNNILLTTAYFPQIYYFISLLNANEVVVEMQENYNKQSFRNRCNILAANGLQTLTVPVKKQNENKMPIKDVQLDYSEDWQRNHLKTILSTYKSAPYFIFYVDKLKKIFETKYKYLLDLNNDILLILFDILKIDKSVKFSDIYITENEAKILNINDCRYIIHPKKVLNYDFAKYSQVFSHKFGFIENLSILDLIFNKGTEAKEFLK